MTTKLPYRHIKYALADQDGGFCALGYILYKSGISHTWLANNPVLNFKLSECTEAEKQYALTQECKDGYTTLLQVENLNNGQSKTIFSDYVKSKPVQAYNLGLKLVKEYPILWDMTLRLIKDSPTYMEDPILTTAPEVPILR